MGGGGRAIGIFAKEFGKFTEKAAAFGAKASEKVAEVSGKGIFDIAKDTGKLMKDGLKFEGHHIGGELKDANKLANFAKKVVKGVGKASEKIGKETAKGFFDSSNLTDEHEQGTFNALKKLAKDHSEKIGKTKLKEGDADKAAQTALAVAHGLEMHPGMKKFYENEGNKKMVDDIAKMHAHDAALKLNGVDPELRHTAATAAAKSHADSMIKSDGEEGARTKSLDKLKEATKSIVAEDFKGEDRGKIGSIADCAIDHYRNKFKGTKFGCENPFIEENQKLLKSTVDKMNKAIDPKNNKLTPEQQEFHRAAYLHNELEKNETENFQDSENMLPEILDKLTNMKKNIDKMLASDNSDNSDSMDNSDTIVQAIPVVHAEHIDSSLVSDKTPPHVVHASLVQASPNGGGSKRIARSYKNKRKTNKRKPVNKRKTVNKRRTKREKYTKRKTVNKRKRYKYTKKK